MTHPWLLLSKYSHNLYTSHSSPKLYTSHCSHNPYSSHISHKYQPKMKTCFVPH